MDLRLSYSVAGPGWAAGRACNFFYVELAQWLTQLVRDTNNRIFPECAKWESNLLNKICARPAAPLGPATERLPFEYITGKETTE